MTIAKRILSMAAALSIVSNNSIPMGLANALGHSDHGERVHNNKTLGDETPTGDEDGQLTSDEDTSNEESRAERPNLAVNFPENDNWVRSLGKYVIRNEDGSNLFYRIEETNFKPNETDIEKKTAATWDIRDDHPLPDGEHYICFYAQWPGSKKATVSEVFHYKLDSSDPMGGGLRPAAWYDVKPEYWQDNFSRTGIYIVNDAPIIDHVSGIEKVYYSCGIQCSNWNELREHGHELKLFNRGDGSYDICLPLQPEMCFKPIYVYIFDKCGRYKIDYYSLNNKAIPKCEYLGTVNRNDSGDETPAITQAYGNEHLSDHPYTNYTYTSDHSYLKVKVSDDDLNKCSVKIKWEEKVNENGTEKVVEQLRDIKLSEAIVCDGSTPEEKIVYVPFSLLRLDDNGNYKFTVWAWDMQFDSEKVDLSEHFYYSKTDGSDVVESIAPPKDNAKIIPPYDKDSGLDGNVNAYLTDTTTKGNRLVFTLKDDLGIAEYTVQIKKDDVTLITENKDLTQGEEKPGSYDTINEDGTVETHEVTYFEPIKSVKSGEFKLNDNGTYVAWIKIKDIDGNEKINRYRFVVDTEAPTINDSTCKIDPEPVYTPYGIYSNQTLTITLDVEDIPDNNFKPDGIQLNIDNGEGEPLHFPADFDSETGLYVIGNIGPVVSGKANITVTDKVGNTKTYYFNNVTNFGEQLTGARLTLTENDVKLMVNTNPPQISIDPVGGSHKFFASKGDDGIVRNYTFFGNSTDNAFTFDFSDANGLNEHDITIEGENGKTDAKHRSKKSYIDGEEAVLSDSVTLPTNLPTGKYYINGHLSNLAGSKSGIPENYKEFFVDKTAPTITGYQVVKAEKIGDHFNITPDSESLTYRNYGIFGNSQIAIAVTVEDNKYSCGIQEVRLDWGDKNPKTYYGVYDSHSGQYIISGIAASEETRIYSGEAKITVKDNLDNENTYYLTTNSLGKNVGELIREDPETAHERVFLTMENGKPGVSLVVGKGSNYIDSKNQKWYAADEENQLPYKVSAKDFGIFRSGLKAVNVYNDARNSSEAIHTEDEYNDVKFEDVRFVKETAEYSYFIKDEGKYILRAEAVDNAGNHSEVSETFYVDSKKPEVTEFVIEGESEKAPFVHNDTYGYFFKEEATVKVYVNDPNLTSGIARVDLFKKEVGGEPISWPAYPCDLHHDGNRTYAEFKIPKGFKGQIGAKVTDNVGYYSEMMNPDGTIIEDEILNSEHASVTITPMGTAVNGFYNHALVLNVTVKDTFSGISNINWSIDKDNKSGQLYASTSDTTLVSDYPVDEKIISTDANLITEVSFQLLVEADESDNLVTVTMTDNAGNPLTTSAEFSLDLTAPAVTTSLGNTDAKNGIYYDKDQQVNLSIVEKNFNGSDAKVLVNGVEQKVAWSGDDSGNGLTHTAKVDLKNDGEYDIKVEYSDLAGNPGTFDPGQHFIIDKTKPVITNNFADFKTGTPDEISGSTELYYNNQGDRKAAFEVNVTDKNFAEEDLNIRVLSKFAGSSHKENEDEEWLETYPEYTWKHDTAKDSHRLTFELDEDNVYKIEIRPVDRAGNNGDIAEGSESKTDIFEVDTTAPVLGARNEGDYTELTKDKYDALAVYDIERFEEEAPFVEFTDTNLYRLEYELTSFKPTYSDGREIGEILPGEKKADEKYSDFEKDRAIDISKSDKALEQDIIRYTVPDFDEDGVYSVKLYAVDMAGNKSEVSDNTYVRLMNTSMLAYIENSSKEDGTGWYSFEDDEYGPISKQPTSFEDLDIVMFSKQGTSPKLLLVDKDTEAEIDTHATSVGDSLIEDELYMVNASKYRLSGDFFATNFTEDTDTRLYLRAENDGKYVDLGEMYIDNTKPECAVPDYLSNWGWLKGSGEQTITFSNISEVLDDEETVVYINGQEVTANGTKATVDGKNVSAFYNAKDDELSVVLPTGTYAIGAKLVDRAGNMHIITEVEHFSVGNTRIWLGAAGATMLIITVGGITAVARSRRRRLSNK